MNYAEFLQLSITEQELIMWCYGVPVAIRHDSLFHYQLVALHGFYVEIIYAIDDNVVRKFVPFNDTAKLDPYLEDLVISFL